MQPASSTASFHGRRAATTLWAAVRWLFVVLLVCDQVSAPLHHHLHDAGVDAHSFDIGTASPTHTVPGLTTDHHDDDDDVASAHSTLAVRSQAPLPADLDASAPFPWAVLSAFCLLVIPPSTTADVAPLKPDRRPPAFSSHRSLPPAGRAPPLHA